ETAQLYYQIALNGRRDLPYAPDEFSGFCMTLLRMLAFAPGSGNSAVAVERPAPRRAAAPAASPAVSHAQVPDAAIASGGTRAPIETASPEPAAQPAPAAQPPEPVAPPAVELVARESAPQAAWDWLAIVAELR